MPPSIDNQVANLQTIFVAILLSARTPTQQRFDTIFKLARAKWFCQIVIRASLKARHFVIQQIVRSQKHRRRIDAAIAQLLQ